VGRKESNAGVGVGRGQGMPRIQMVSLSKYTLGVQAPGSPFCTGGDTEQ
jgi:hypothetical protein